MDEKPVTAPTQGRRSSFLTNVLKLVSGTTLAQLITILTAPVIARLFSPEAFGILNAFTSLMGILAIIVCLRYEYAIVLPEEEADAANVFVLCLLISVLVSGMAGLVLLLVGKPLVSLLRAPELYRFLWLVPVGLFIHGLFQALNYWNTRSKHFGRLSIARVGASLTTSALPMLLAWLGRADAASLVLAYIAGLAVFLLVLGVQVLRDSLGLFVRYAGRARLLANLKRYRKFPLVDSWSSFINNLSWQLPSLMLLYFFSESVVGYYSLSNRLILLPMTLLGTSVAQVFYQRTAELRSNPDSLSRSVELVFRRLASIGLFPALVLAIAGPELFGIVFGANWMEAGRYAQILSPWMFILFISSPLASLFSTLERQELALKVNIVILVTRIAALAIGGLTNNIFTTLIIWTGILVYGGLALWLLRLANVAWQSAARSILQVFIYASVPGLLYLALKAPLAGHGIWMVVVTAIVSIGYYVIVLARDNSMRSYLLALMPQRTTHPG
jgi:O-antigen/teichoic acid export membrane protein